jgi:AbrB family looped-hinge helix DNA binding protein
LSSKGQVVIPKEIRDMLGLKEGDKLVIGVESAHVVIEPVRHSEWRDLEGAFGPVDQTTAEILAEGRAEERRKED